MSAFIADGGEVPSSRRPEISTVLRLPPAVLPAATLAGLAALCLAAGCDAGRGRGTAEADGGADLARTTPDPDDKDGDGATPAQGDCDDGDATIGPMAFELAGNQIDDDCDGMKDEPPPGACDDGTFGQKDGVNLAKAIGLCDPRFFVGAELRGPSDVRARDVVSAYGLFQHTEGSTMALFSTGIAADKASASYVRPQLGTTLDQANEHPNPDLTLPGVPGCGTSQPAVVQDYTELAIKLRVPTNARSLTFQLQFFSAEYPEYVCTAWNDEFLVELESKKNATVKNISFDAMSNPITVNSGFFTICQNDAQKPQTQHCSRSIDELEGTGLNEVLLDRPIGGATGWLRTRAPVIPGDEITLRFIIFDEGDHIYDSSAIVDAFAWSTDVIDAPVTVP
jgi:hypothetical protein